MQFHNLKPNTANKKSKRVGRGGKRGKTSGRGTKGQKARAGHSLRPELRDIIKKMPKLRGHGKNRARGVNSSREQATVVNIVRLSVFGAGERVTPSALLAKGLIAKRGGRVPRVKILGDGALARQLVFSGVTLSRSAKEKVEKAGGSVV
jgi:large subunit ribosomal protein L15